MLTHLLAREISTMMGSSRFSTTHLTLLLSVQWGNTWSATNASKHLLVITLLHLVCLNSSPAQQEPTNLNLDRPHVMMHH